jgi:putative hemolysin
MTSDSIIFALILALSLALSFVFSGMEAGIQVLSRFRVRRLMRTGVRRAKLLHQFLEEPEDFLWTILVGNTLASFSAFTLTVVALFDLLGESIWRFTAAFAVMIFFYYALCDLLPKMLFQQFPNRLCLALAVPFRVMHAVLSPLVQVLTWFSNLLLLLTGQKRAKGNIFGSRRELRLAIQGTAETLTTEERAMVNRVLDLQEIPVRKLALPLAKVISLEAESPVRELLETCRKHPVHWLPLWKKERDQRRIVGLVNLSTLLYTEGIDANQPISRYARAPLYLREDVRLEEALRRMQSTRQRMAVVLGFDRRELGVISLRDILKWIFGEVTL